MKVAVISNNQTTNSYYNLEKVSPSFGWRPSAKQASAIKYLEANAPHRSKFYSKAIYNNIGVSSYDIIACLKRDYYLLSALIESSLRKFNKKHERSINSITSGIRSFWRQINEPVHISKN